MSITDIYETGVVTIEKQASIYEAAKLMKQHNVGNVIVVENKEASSKPVGILTDRDIVVKAIADEVDLQDILVADAMSEQLLVLKKQQGVFEVLEQMAAKGVRRAPVVDDNNKLVGILSSDDLLILLANETHKLAQLVDKQIGD